MVMLLSSDSVKLHIQWINKNTNSDPCFLVTFYQVVSDKQLVKHLQKEVARLEAELRTPDPSKERDFKIQQVNTIRF